MKAMVKKVDCLEILRRKNLVERIRKDLETKVDLKLRNLGFRIRKKIMKLAKDFKMKVFKNLWKV
jgi:hypothetical protein